MTPSLRDGALLRLHSSETRRERQLSPLASPGISVVVRENLNAYFFVQIPVVRDFNGGLIPDLSYLAGLSMAFN